jgi:hypothetical protein
MRFWNQHHRDFQASFGKVFSISFFSCKKKCYSSGSDGCRRSKAGIYNAAKTMELETKAQYYHNWWLNIRYG